MAKVKLNITSDEDLLKQLDEYAEDNYTSKSAVVTQGVTQILMADKVAKSLSEIAVMMKVIADKGELDPDGMRKLQEFSALASLLAGK